MKISKQQLKSIIQEVLPPHLKKHFNKDGSAKAHNPMGYEIKDVTPPGYGPGVEAAWIPWLEERGLSVEDLDDLARFTGAPDRNWLPAEPPADGMDGPADIEFWARNKKARIKEGKMKITKRQLRRIIREELLREQQEGWDQIHGRAADYAPSLSMAKLGIEKTLQHAKRRRDDATADPELSFMADDADDLESIASQFEHEVSQGASPGSFSVELRSSASRLDTAVRDDIHPNLYYSLFPELL